MAAEGAEGSLPAIEERLAAEVVYTRTDDSYVPLEERSADAPVLPDKISIFYRPIVEACASETEIREGISGNFCRCTGYQHIVNAIQHAANKR
mgnify:CR=1 FL=1